MASEHDRMLLYVHARGLMITTPVKVGARSAARLAVTKIKTMKINSEGLFRLFTKFSTLENYPPYGTWQLASVVIDTHRATAHDVKDVMSPIETNAKLTSAWQDWLHQA